jgi:hypothetical protein
MLDKTPFAQSADVAPNMSTPGGVLSLSLTGALSALELSGRRVPATALQVIIRT